MHGVGVQVLTDVNVALHDGVVAGLVDAGRTPFPGMTGLEQGLGAPESLVADGDHLTVGELVCSSPGSSWRRQSVDISCSKSRAT